MDKFGQIWEIQFLLRKMKKNSGKIWKKIVNFVKSLKNGQIWTNLKIYFYRVK